MKPFGKIVGSFMEGCMRKFLFVAVMLPALASGAVYKCTDASGKVNFSDRPCAVAEQGGEVEVKTVNSVGSLGLPDDFRDRSLENSQRRREQSIERRLQNRAAARANEPCKTFSDQALRTMTIQNQVVPGMRVGDARRAWGTPSRVNGNQYVYRWGNSLEASYFYERNGCIEAVDGSYRGPRAVR